MDDPFLTMFNLLMVMPGLQSWVVVTVVAGCSLASNLVLTSLQLEIYTGPEAEQRRRLLNILYSHLAAQWQLDTLLASTNILAQMVCGVQDSTFITTINQIMQMDFLFGSLYFVTISIIRVIKHFNSELYLSLGVEHSGHWSLPAVTSCTLAIQLVKLASCGTVASSCYELSSACVLFGLQLVTLVLHLAVGGHILLRRLQNLAQVEPFLQDADLISFSTGSTTLLILGSVLITVLVIFSLLSVPVTSVVSSLIQLTNITLISLYWLISRPCLRVRTILLIRRLFCRQQSVFIVPVS